MNRMNEIPKIVGDNFDEFVSKYLYADIPVILKGAASHWNAVKKWSADYLIQTMGTTQITYKKTGSNLHPNLEPRYLLEKSGKEKGSYATKKTNDFENSQFIESSFESYIQKLLTDSFEDRSKYFLGGDVDNFSFFGKKNPKLLPLFSDFIIPPCIPENKIERIGFWMTGRNANSWLHYDGGGACNINAQVTGKKTIYLYDPDEAKNLYMFLATHGEPLNFSQVNFLNPDFNKFPLFESATALVGELEEGDMVYIPRYWIHGFKHTGNLNINVNFWWNTDNVKLNPLSAREDYFERCKSAYDCDGKFDHQSLINFIKLLEENPAIKNVVERVEKSILDA